MSNELRSRAKDDSDNESIASVASTAAPTISREGRKTDKKHFFEHQEYEFGGPAGVVAMMIGFPLLMYYFYICMQANDGWFLYPKSTADVVPLLKYLWEYAKEHAYPHKKAWGIYLGLMTMEFVLAVVMPGFKQKGLPVPSLKYKSLDYNCNALSCFYATLLISAGLHLTHTFRLSEIVDNFGPLMTVAIIVGYGCSLLIYVLTVLFGKPLRMSGNFFYDFFMGASLNPRLLGVDIKMWAEVRVPWVLLFGIAVSGACKQYDQYGTVSPNMAFMVLATGLYINACAKGEECIPQTWDMAWEKFGYMLCFWNFAGVPFTYCYPVLYLLNHRPEEYSWSWVTYTLLFGVLLTSYTIFDLAMAQKSRFKMQQQGIHKFRKTFPQIPGATPKNPTFVQTQHGSKLLTSGPWAYARKPNYCADWIQATSWGFSTGIPFLTSPPIPHWYSVWFFIVLVHRCGRDFERCSQKYGEDWEEYCRRVPYKFIPYVW
ncbi:ERG4/ERG24 ergosterol biosynthesis protein [Wallemia mellicola CBS 633.66]|nr:ERG4/ERG24 ergosterol biosynthesis protein [Wallemia mellicola CBS 633.66]EIM19584.1 ERG4/ERG24 ergosterol biosynthesis protein [Wallemia mellicola CBS 633.66]|eukprot:XP_006960382.1 ERG4/ERG24 ergosterol biosynthesis protein [Wallemia mellicola CBS 633.66]